MTVCVCDAGYMYVLRAEVPVFTPLSKRPKNPTQTHQTIDKDTRKTVKFTFSARKVENHITLITLKKGKF